MLDGSTTLPDEQDEAALLGDMCALVARDRRFCHATIASVLPDGGRRIIAHASQGGSRVGTVCAEVAFRVGGEHLLFRAGSNEPGAFGPEEISVLEDLCALWGRLLENLRGREMRLRSERDRANHAEQRLSALWKVANGTRSAKYDSKALAREVLLEGREQLHLQMGYIARIDGEHIILEIVCSESTVSGSCMPLENKRIPIDGTLAQLVHTNNATQSVTDALGVIRCGIGTPFTANGENYLLVFVCGKVRHAPFTEQDERYVELLASVFCRTLEQRATLDQVEYLRDHDTLTRLPHRNRFHARLSELLLRAAQDEPVAVLIIDTDRFRQLLEQYGPEAGDEIVLELAQRIRLAKGERHELFRYRSDSFAIIVHGPRAMTEVHFLAERCIAAIGAPMKINGEEAHLTASIGISLAPSDGIDVSSLSIAATTAMRRAKRMGPAQFRFYNELLDERFGRRRIFAEELREAAGKNELFLYYQPIVNLQTRAVIGAEALLRWHHPRRGIVGAAEFIHIAEESDLINEIGSWVLQSATEQARMWSDAGKDLVIAVNLSARQFRDAGLLSDVESALRTSGIEPRLLEFEVTESIAMHDPERAAYTLACFRDLGLRVALDDFGTGHSSLAYLKRFPIDIIKLDQTFVAGVPEENTSAAIANAVVALATSLGCEVRAEGIEKPAQEQWLRELGVHSAQGFLIAPALLPRAFERWLDGVEERSAYRA